MASQHFHDGAVDRAASPRQEDTVLITPPGDEVTHQPHFVSSSSFTIIMYSILATALFCLWIWLVSISSSRVRKMPAFTILTLATVAYCVQTMLEVSRTVDLLTGRVTEDRERPVAIVFFLFAVPWISDWTFVPRLLAFFPPTIHSTKKRLLVLLLPVTMKICRAIFIVLFTMHTYRTTHGPPLDETTFYRDIAFSTAYPQLEWIATILDEGYSTAFLIDHLMLFKRGHIRSKPLLSAVRTVIFASVATFALPLAFCCTSISLQYAHMDPKVTRDAWVAAEFVIVLGAYASCLAPTLRAEHLAKRALTQQMLITPEASNLPPLFTPVRGPQYRPDISRRNSLRSKSYLHSGQRSTQTDRGEATDVELGSLSLSHLKDTPLASPKHFVHSDCVEMVRSTPVQRSSLDESIPRTPPTPQITSRGEFLLPKSSSLTSLRDARFAPAPHLLPTLVHAHEPDINFRLEPSVHVCPTQQAQKASRLTTPPEGRVTFQFPVKRNASLPLREEQTAKSRSAESASRSSDDKTLHDSGDKMETVETASSDGKHQPKGNNRSPRSLRFSNAGALKHSGRVTPDMTVRPWTATGATGVSGSPSILNYRRNEELGTAADFFCGPGFFIDMDMPFASNFAPSTRSRHSDSELRRGPKKEKPWSQHTSPSLELQCSHESDIGHARLSSSEVLLSSPTRQQPHTNDGGGSSACALALNKPLAAEREAIASASSVSTPISLSPVSSSNSAAGVIRKSKVLGINTARASKFLHRPASATATIDGGIESGSSCKRRADKLFRPFSPTASHNSVRRGDLKNTVPLSLGHIEIVMQRTTKIDYAFEEARGQGPENTATVGADKTQLVDK